MDFGKELESVRDWACCGEPERRVHAEYELQKWKESYAVVEKIAQKAIATLGVVRSYPGIAEHLGTQITDMIDNAMKVGAGDTAPCHECGWTNGHHLRTCRGYRVDPETGEPIPPQNFVFSTGTAEPLPLVAPDRRFHVASGKTETTHNVLADRPAAPLAAGPASNASDGRAAG